MCGIAGLMDSAGPQPALRRMLDRLAHRGPDDSGDWLDDSGTLALGHRRLSIVDLSNAGKQPMVSPSGRYVLVYNGEIYNHKQLRNDLDCSGAAPSWRGHSDTEVLVAGIEAWGIEQTLRRSNGMFALAVYDRAQRKLTLARDRMGEKPLYFGWLGSRFAFASELPAFREVSGWAPRMHNDAIASFLLTGYVRGTQSAVEGIFRLPPATHLTLHVDELTIARDWTWLSTRLKHYWSLTGAALEGLDSPLDADIDDAADELEALLKDAVDMRMMADVPIGAFLSGGVDSSLVTALMQIRSPRPIRTFSIGFEEAEFDEAPRARAVARHLGTNHTELYVSAKDALATVPRLAETFDEPFADQSQIPTLLLSALTRRHVSVALSGDGGDEMFGGYARYFIICQIWRGFRHLPYPLRRTVAPTLALVGRKLGPITAFARHGRTLPFRLERLSERLSAQSPEAMRISFIAGGGSSRIVTTPYAPGLEHCLPPIQMRDSLARLMFGDQLDYLPDDILHKVDRATMAVGLECRVPILDHRVVEFSWRLPARMRTRGNQGKILLRSVLNRHVPAKLFEGPKQGFSPPISTWLRGPLREWAQPLLSEPSLRELPMIDGNSVRDMWIAHQDGRVDAGQALWNVLMLADWRRHFAVLT